VIILERQQCTWKQYNVTMLKKHTYTHLIVYVGYSLLNNFKEKLQKI